MLIRTITRVTRPVATGSVIPRVATVSVALTRPLSSSPCVRPASVPPAVSVVRHGIWRPHHPHRSLSTATTTISSPVSESRSDAIARLLPLSATNNDAAYELSTIFLSPNDYGTMTTDDINHGIQLLQRAAAAGHIDATCALATALLTGHGGIARDETPGLQLLARAADGGSIAAQRQIGNHYSATAMNAHRNGNQMDIATTSTLKGLHYLRLLAKQSSPDVTAHDHFLLAASLTNASATLGGAAGNVDRALHREALKHFELAAADGHEQAAGYAAASLQDGSTRDDGKATRDDQIAAVKWATVAANGGESRGHAALGRAYQYGEGVEVNNDLAIDHYQNAAEARFIPSLLPLAQLLWHTSRHSSAVDWWHTAVDIGCSVTKTKACIRLGQAYAHGWTNQPIDNKQARVWLERAIDIAPSSQPALVDESRAALTALPKA